jgi:signal transduction histidine kinase
MKMFGGPTSMNLKLALVIIGAAIAFGTLYYTQNLVAKLQDREKQIVQLYANSLQSIVSTDTPNTDFTFIFQNIIQRIDFPLILTDSNDKPVLSSTNYGYKNIYPDPKISPKELIAFLDNEISELKKQHQPIEVKTQDGRVIQKIYFGDSDIVTRLKYYPYLQIFFAILFIIVAYSSFSYIKRSEQGNIWVGMSKETAHQLGTPISSLMGWNEMLRMYYANPDKVLDTADEIESDLTRLNKITKRFSKIGSKPELRIESPYVIINHVINYFQRRLPQLGKNVELKIEGSQELAANLNSELFEWVIENLIKNALDAIDHKNGKINFAVSSSNKNILIEVSDNGKGIDYSKWKDIFRPGYSTKRRGWGLGLSLSKRIIVDYHKGKIFVKNSVINEGTTFNIILKLADEKISKVPLS